ncbi:hypothetical protein [Magnetospira sp. QH-2]|uniref:hypothetical protein n=1 Tax=Magnetospira sp. (strain QH-2) TaxID=1288970 RepID=UPI0003E813DE|nr:hypothetical protein [Magnetospira sp. QH-2]CCQ73721.1 Conserved exported protein of unknown function [Magnetospira sp. QH-2]
MGWNRRALGLGICIGLLASGSQAGEVRVVDADVVRSGDGSYRFDVTLRHGDEGWDHYANQWQIVAPDGQVLGTRTLLHPHVNEQPFTRSLGGVRIPPGVDHVDVMARDSKHGIGGKPFRVLIPNRP